jgi:hypothetical protein
LVREKGDCIIADMRCRTGSTDRKVHGEGFHMETGMPRLAADDGGVQLKPLGLIHYWKGEMEHGS